MQWTNVLHSKYISTCIQISLFASFNREIQVFWILFQFSLLPIQIFPFSIRPNSQREKVAKIGLNSVGPEQIRGFWLRWGKILQPFQSSLDCLSISFLSSVFWRGCWFGVSKRVLQRHWDLVSYFLLKYRVGNWVKGVSFGWYIYLCSAMCHWVVGFKLFCFRQYLL